MPKKNISKIEKEEKIVEQPLLKKKESKITPDMTIADVIEQNPNAKEKLMMMGLGCAGCHFASYDTLENGAKIHGMDVDEILHELND